MTRKEAMRQNQQADTLRALGFTTEEAGQLRRISMTLHRWHERECGTDNGRIERDEATGKAMWRSSYSGKAYPVRDMEAGALRRLKAVMERRNNTVRNMAAAGLTAEMTQPLSLQPYIQGDPHDAALYILRPGDVPVGGDPGAYYSRGVVVY